MTLHTAVEPNRLGGVGDGVDPLLAVTLRADFLQTGKDGALSGVARPVEGAGGDVVGVPEAELDLLALPGGNLLGRDGEGLLADLDDDGRGGGGQEGQGNSVDGDHFVLL